MKSMLASMAVVLTFCAAPAAAAEFPKTGSAEYDTYYVDEFFRGQKIRLRSFPWAKTPTAFFVREAA